MSRNTTIYFNSNFEYDVGHEPGVACMYFGGQENSMFDIISFNWYEYALADILEKIRGIETELGLPRIEFEEFSKTLAGTIQLYAMTFHRLIIANAEHRKYLFGVLLYHQLLYTNPLECNFDW